MMPNRFERVMMLLVLVASCLPLAAQTYTLQAFNVPYAPKASTFALGINNRGAVVGYIYYKDPQIVSGWAVRGFKRSADGVFERPIDDPNDQPLLDTVATGINNSGVICGYYFHYSGGYYPGFLRSQGVFTDYGLPGRNTLIFGMNNKGDLVGQLTDSAGLPHGFASINGVVSLLHFPGGQATTPYGVAADGTIVGSFLKNGRTWGFLRGPAGQYKAFQVPGAIDTNPYGVNNVAHKIVGSYYTQGITHGFVYDYITGMTITVDWSDPNTFFTEVTGINSKGVIVGTGAIRDSQGQALPGFGLIGTPQ